MISKRAAPLMHCFVLGWRETWTQRVPLAGTFLSFAVMIAVWASVWRLVPPATLSRASLSYAAVIWYFTAAEIVAFSLGHCYRRVENLLQGGDVLLHLVRPVSFVTLTTAEELGHVMAKIALVAAPGAGLAYGLTGTVPVRPALVLPLLLLLVGGAALYLVAQMLIGLTAAWFGTARPVFFITQKFLFVLGGLVVPLSAYPEALQRIAWLTPFPAMLYAPASLALDRSVAHAAAMLAVQMLWLAVAAAALHALGAAFERRITLRGLDG
ncbi:MAG TPA: ABC-2 family transporter protein [Gammaproteobacteria bacterium]|nr:ABC-2 family transporter protein [Gammaproteobacteria bacterium]